MTGFIDLVSEVLGVSLTIGATSLTLGGIALGAAIMGIGLSVFRRLGGKR